MRKWARFYRINPMGLKEWQSPDSKGTNSNLKKIFLILEEWAKGLIEKDVLFLL